MLVSEYNIGPALNITINTCRRMLSDLQYSANLQQCQQANDAILQTSGQGPNDYLEDENPICY